MTRTAILAVLVGAVVAVIAVPGFVKLDEPNSDGLFYEVQRLQVEGHDEAEATRMVFDGAIGRQTAEIEDEPDEPRVLDPAWVEYSKRFYRRRWLVPALAAGVAPVVGEQPGRALRVASLIGYVLIAPVLFLLLRRRFPPALSALLALACTLAPPVYKWSLGMRVDSWGLMLEALCLLAVVLVKDLGPPLAAALGRGGAGAVGHPRRHGDPDPGGGVAAVRGARRPRGRAHQPGAARHRNRGGAAGVPARAALRCGTTSPT